MSIKDVKKLLKKQGLHPSKRLGQNFLINKKVLRKIIKVADLSKNDIVLEIGPGIGNLTLELAKQVKRVIAIEKDERMCRTLKEVLEESGIRNVEIIKGDVLKIKNGSMAKWLNGYKIVANIPYYLTSPLIRKFLEAKNQPKEMILMVQKEVAQRICAKPPEMSLLAVSVQFYARPKIISFVSKKSFWPQPNVDSAIIRIIPHQPAPHPSPSVVGFRERFFRIAKTGFSHPRKQLINNLSLLNVSSKNLSGKIQDKKANRGKVKRWLLRNKIKPSQRAETLSLNNWQRLTKKLKIH